jgi:hypothetical protein
LTFPPEKGKLFSMTIGSGINWSQFSPPKASSVPEGNQALHHISQRGAEKGRLKINNPDITDRQNGAAQETITLLGQEAAMALQLAIIEYNTKGSADNASDLCAKFEQANAQLHKEIADHHVPPEHLPHVYRLILENCKTGEKIAKNNPDNGAAKALAEGSNVALAGLLEAKTGHEMKVMSNDEAKAWAKEHPDQQMYAVTYDSDGRVQLEAVKFNKSESKFTAKNGVQVNVRTFATNYKTELATKRQEAETWFRKEFGFDDNYELSQNELQVYENLKTLRDLTKENDKVEGHLKQLIELLHGNTCGVNEEKEGNVDALSKLTSIYTECRIGSKKPKKEIEMAIVKLRVMMPHPKSPGGELPPKT